MRTPSNLEPRNDECRNLGATSSTRKLIEAPTSGAAGSNPIPSTSTGADATPIPITWMLSNRARDDRMVIIEPVRVPTPYPRDQQPAASGII
jgi:hypothetical protein